MNAVDATPDSAGTAPPDLVAALASSGIHLSPPETTPGADALRSAVNVARVQFGPAGTAVAIPAIVTVEGYHLGDENSPLMIEERPVIVVQITGLSMPPLGGGYGDPVPDESQWSNELVVLVDAATGEYLLATSVR